jgi:hypothetical protein
VTDALAHLRAHREGLLLAAGIPRRIRFVQHAGSLVFPAEPALVEADSLTLCLPDEAPAGDDELQLMLSAALTDDGAAADRWRIYHGEPDRLTWVACIIEGARFMGRVVEHDILNTANPLAAIEPALCRTLNADRARLAMVCRLITGVLPESPVAVGVDDLGIDLRARFGIIRLPFREPVPTPDLARDRIASLFGGAPRP